ncbi:MAG: hypothetical protein ACK56K_01350, partial [Akkermansiaceae bacterium]
MYKCKNSPRGKNLAVFFGNLESIRRFYKKTVSVHLLLCFTSIPRFHGQGTSSKKSLSAFYSRAIASQSLE